MACTIGTAPTALWLIWPILAVACGGSVGIDNVEPDSGTGGVEGYEPGTSSGGSNQIGTGGVEQSGGSGGLPASGGATVEPCGTLIDDMEDGSGRICAGEGRIGVWYAFNDGSGIQWPEPTTPGVPILPSPVEGGRDGSYLAMHTSGEGFSRSALRTLWGAGIGVDLNFDGTTYGTYDALDYEGISFWARSDLDEGSDIYVRVNSTATTSVEYGGTCEWEVEDSYTCNPAFGVVSLSTTWQFYELPFVNPSASTGDDLYPYALANPGYNPFDRGQLTSIQFFGATGYTLSNVLGDDVTFDFWIDDLRFY